MSDRWELHEMDCRLAMAMLIEADSIDSIVGDPPYGLSKEPDAAEVLRHWLDGDDYTHSGNGFMGKSWDSFVPGPSVWREAYRVLKPGGHLVAFFGTRTYDLGCMAIRLAGFEIRDQAQWLYGSGFPKSLDVSKAIDKAAGEQGSFGEPKSAAHAGWIDRGRMRGEQGHEGYQRPWMQDEEAVGNAARQYLPATDGAREWSGWGTALKPANEPIVIARKPLSEPTVAANVLRWGTGALNIDGCRVGDEERFNPPASNKAGGNSLNMSAVGMPQDAEGRTAVGRWPANVMHDGSPDVLAEFPDTSSGVMKAGTMRAAQDGPGSVCYGKFGGPAADTDTLGDSGSAARFFYCAKASKSDRNEGCDALPTRTAGITDHTGGQHLTRRDVEYEPPLVANGHPTVKPTNLMRWLCRLVTPPGGLVLDPFTGSGSTGKAALLEGFRFVGCEMTPEYAAIARARLTAASIAVTMRATRA